MIVNNLGIILFPGLRSRAYLQILLKNDYIPSVIFSVNTGKDEEIKDQSFIDAYKKDSDLKFNIFEPVEETLKKYNLDYKEISAESINDFNLINELKQLDEEYFIFTGGGILKDDILNIGKDIIHIHPGIVPFYRGSTCFYYSIIDKDNIGATGIFLRKILDTGPVLKKMEFDMPVLNKEQGAYIDNIYDPYFRSLLLLEIIKEYAQKGKFSLSSQNVDEGETYFIIHPVLKHLAIMKCINN